MSTDLRVVEFATPHSGRILSQSDRDQTIASLESIISAVRDGSIIGVAGVVLHPDNGTLHFRHGYQSTSMLGRVDMLKQRIIDELMRE